MPEALQIIENRQVPVSLDFAKLRQEGIKHIAELGGDLWTDHNVHDPGVTILEALCYALTDLGYRSQFKIEELLARPPQAIQGKIPDNNFFTPAEILSCNPLTILDYRKLLVDIDGVRNAWLEPASKGEVDLYINCQNNKIETEPTDNTRPLCLNGLYKVYLELEPNVLSTSPCSDDLEEIATRCGLLDKVKTKLNAHRNLGEDFLDICILKKQDIGICSDIELKADANPDEVLAKILEVVQLFFSPPLTFYSLAELLAKGKSMEDIFAGRPLTFDSHGFVEMEVLEKLKRWKEIHVSDIYREIMKISGVKGIKNLALVGKKTEQSETLIESWCLALEDGYCPEVCFAGSSINFYKGVLPFEADETKAKRLFKERLSNYQKVKLSPDKLDGNIPNGKYRADLGDYYSVQHDFPIVYGVGADGLSNTATFSRKAQALQLKGYLLFFDQLLANYLSQLANLRQLFAIRPNNGGAKGPNQSYFTGDLESVPDLEQLIPYHEKANPDFHPKMVLASLYKLATTTDTTFEKQFYDSAAQRDEAIIKWTKAFEQNQIKVGSVKDGVDYFFTFSNLIDQTILQSAGAYPEKEKAEAVAHSLIFLGRQLQAYHAINKQNERQFTFEFIYNPIDYKEFSSQLQESPQKYFQRKNQFLNHLLARFSEEFSNYVLLTFALDGNNNNPEKIIEDKSKYLQNYPEISRNRGKAFDYQQEKVWDTNNISGLERRVTHLMGIPDWQRSTMGNFEAVTAHNEAFIYELYDQFICTAEDTAHKDIIPANKNPIYRSLQAFQNEDQAKFAFEVLQKQVRKKERYKKINCEVNQTFGFQIINEQSVPIAEYPSRFSSPKLRDEAMACMQNWIDGSPWANITGKDEELIFGPNTGWMAYILPIVTDQQEVEKYRFEIKWLNCLGICETLLIGEERNNRAAAIEDVAQLRQFIINTDCSDLLKPDDEKVESLFSFYIEEPNCQALHPVIYNSDLERDKVLTEAKNYLEAFKKHQAANYWAICIIENPCIISDYCFEGTEVNSKKAFQRIRLKKENYSIATYEKSFTTKENRDLEIEELVLQIQQQPLDYSTHRIEVLKEEYNYAYQLITEGKNTLTWCSTNGFDSADTARKKAEDNNYFLHLIDLAREKSNYRVRGVKGEYQLFLLDKEGNYVLKSSKVYSDKEAIYPIDDWVQNARACPIIRRDGKWAFQIVEKTSNNICWTSTEVYETPENAWDAFRDFWHLLQYRGNYTAIDNVKDNAGNKLFKIALGKVFLESKKIYEGIAENSLPEATLIAKENAWSGLDHILEVLQEEGNIRYRTDYANNCRYSFQVVSNDYLQIVHPTPFNTRLEANHARDYLFEKMKDIADFYLKQHFVEKYPIIGSNEFLWRSTDKAGIPSEGQAQVKIFNYATNKNFYQKIIKEEGYYFIALVDECGDTIAKAVEKEGQGNYVIRRFDTNKPQILEELAIVIEGYIQDAKKYPFFINDKNQYGIQLTFEADFTTTIPFKNKKKKETSYTFSLQDEVIWKHQLTFKNLEQAQTSFKNDFLPLLKNKTNYIIQGDDTCGPFTIEVINPEEICAIHPNSYPCKEDRDAAISQMLALVSVEGFHVLEHILLRPRGFIGDQEVLKEKLFPICVDSLCCEEIPVPQLDLPKEIDTYNSYLPDADPYSFWATIVLPYWPKRFQKTAFRKFFEGTLRREIPAHIALSIAWVSPKQLKEFEETYRTWLETLNYKNNCAAKEEEEEEERKRKKQNQIKQLKTSNQLIEVIMKLENVYPPVRLSKGVIDDESSPTILDFSILR